MQTTTHTDPTTVAPDFPSLNPTPVMGVAPVAPVSTHVSTTDEIAALCTDADPHNVHAQIGTVMDSPHTQQQQQVTLHAEEPHPQEQQHHHVMNEPTTIIFPFSEFEEDVEQRLGRANGNIFHRKPGVEGLHDGQIMVRLKKKRFIIIDYSIVPNTADIAAASMTPSIMCPNGAGKHKCVQSECTKVGVPVMLYDSDPEQPSSLYLRSGLCFSCQRLLNEKRRTQRKRKSDVQPNAAGTNGTNPANQLGAAGLGHGPAVGANGNQINYSIDPGQKRFRLNGEILDLNPDAIIINGPLEGTKHHGPGYEYGEIVADLERITQEVSAETSQLASSVASLSDFPANAASPDGASSMLEEQANSILATYDKTFLSMSKGIFLLSQWKSSWDSAVATAAAEKASEQAAAAAAADTSILDGSAIAEAVASAAAVAAAQSAGDTSSNMIPLLLAADANKEAKVEGADEHEVPVAPVPAVAPVEEATADTEIFTV